MAVNRVTPRSRTPTVADPGTEIDPLCVRNVRYFLHERQKKHDPLGFRVAAVRPT